jgi:uncharacterized protein YidB (DUF937 family)
MGLLDELLGGLAEGEPRREPEAPRARATGTPAGAGMSKVLMALLPVVLAMLANRGGAPSAGPGAGMGGGGLGDILGQILGGGAGSRSGTGGGGDLGDLLGQILGGGAGPRSGMAGPGGLGDLLDAFQRAGYAEQTRSWVGTGQNLPISPDVIGQVFGHDGLSQIAARTGLTEEKTSAGLSQLLPEVVDKLTPDGQVPDLDALAESVGQMARRLRA